MRHRSRSSAFVLSLVSAIAASGGPMAAETPVGGEFGVSAQTDAGQSEPQVATAANGDFVVVWSDWLRDGSESGIFGRLFDATGRPLGPDFQINTSTAGDQFRPAVARHPDGSFVVVWESDHLGAIFGLFAQRFDASGNPLGGEFQVNTVQGVVDLWPDVAADDAGSFVVVWNRSGVLAQRFDSVGQRIGGELAVSAGGGTAAPAVAMAPDGRFVVTWTRLSSGPTLNDIYARRFDASGHPAGGEFLVNTTTPLHQDNSTAGMHQDGSFVLLWEGFDGNSSGVFGQLFDESATPLGGEFQLNIYTDSYQGDPSVALDADGDFVATWTSSGQDGSLDGIFGREYLADGTPVDEEFQVNTTTVLWQFDASVAAAPDGDFVVVWRDGFFPSEGDIFGQRYVGPDFHLEINGTCPGLVEVHVLNAYPSGEVAAVGAANANGYVKGGQLCPGSALEIGEPFSLPPLFVAVDEQGRGSGLLNLRTGRCHVQALDLGNCETSNTVLVP